MIKQYFTDGLIGLAILLSIFRTDLISLNINNLINYPEVQDIILGQTAAYLPANFHAHLDIYNGLSHPKHIELDNDAVSALYRNFNISSLLHGGPNDIEAFLVSGSQNGLGSESFHNDSTGTQDVSSSPNNNEDGPQLSSQTLPEESAGSFSSIVNSSSSRPTQSTSNGSSSHTEQPVAVDITFLFNDNPFPGCNLSREDLNLIDALWRQDEDLGVGKEVYDQNLREELERKRQSEFLKQQEKEKAQLAAREKEDRAKQEQADRWLKQNFMQDGETGEWVKLHNGTDRETNNTLHQGVDDEFLTLEAALDYICSNGTVALLPELDNTDKHVHAHANSFVEQLPSFQPNLTQEQQFPNVQTESQQSPPFGELPSPPFGEVEDNFEDTWNELVGYLDEATNQQTALPQDKELACDVEEQTSSIPSNMNEALDVTQEIDDNDFLLQNATLPSADLDLYSDLCTLAPIPNEVDQSIPPQSVSMTSTINWGFEDMGLFTNITDLQDVAVEELDLEGVDEFFDDGNSQKISNISSATMDVLEDMESVVQPGGNLSDAALSLSGSSPEVEFGDCFDGLEGATGGSNFTDQSFDGHEDGPFKKLSRLSESSTDSGFSYRHGGLPSSSSSSCSSYAGSPSSSCHGNSSTASNDTEHDPPGSRALTNHVAHNHTYNTQPGQVPREVKKYAQKQTSRKGPQSRDQKRANELKIPFSVDEIIGSPVESFNEMLTKHDLNEAQLNMIRDIRRRGKNKVAAQNCRKRKVGMIVTLVDEMVDLQEARDRLLAERMEMERESRRMKEKFGSLYSHIFQSLRDERGEPYDPNQYSLQQSTDGNVFLVPRNVSSNGRNSTAGKDGQTKGLKKRKSLGN